MAGGAVWVTESVILIILYSIYAAIFGDSLENHFYLSIFLLINVIIFVSLEEGVKYYLNTYARERVSFLAVSNQLCLLRLKQKANTYTYIYTHKLKTLC